MVEKMDENSPWRIDVMSLRSPKLPRKEVPIKPIEDLEFFSNFQPIINYSPRIKKHRSPRPRVRFNSTESEPRFNLGEKRGGLYDDIPKKKVRFDAGAKEEAETPNLEDADDLEELEFPSHDKALKRQRFVAFDFSRSELNCAKKKKGNPFLKNEMGSDLPNMKSLCQQFEHADISN